MTGLSQEQLAEVAKWFAGGASLDEIQKRINGEFGVHLTYLDVRLMVAELPQPVEDEADEPSAPSSTAVSTAPNSPADLTDATDPKDPTAPMVPGEELPPAGEIEVVVDPLAPPGCIACGSVTFSDGNTGKWMLDQMGRLGLSGLPEGYRPSPEDSAQFQPKLVAALRARGLV